MSHALELGGAERSLIGLLEEIDTTKYDVDLFLMRHEGELFNLIPKKIHLLPEIAAYTVLGRPMKSVLKEGHVLLLMARVFGKIKAWGYDRVKHNTDSAVALEYSHKYTCPFMPEINKDDEYDLAISFLTPHYFVVEKVNAKKKIAWIHTDYSKIQVNAQSEYKMWNSYDHIVSISDAVTENFLKVFPQLKSKICLVENILPKVLIENQKKAFLVEKEMPQKGIRLLSIGRYCLAKNFDNIPQICSLLLEKGLDIYWYIIGYGSDEQLIKDRIHQYNVKDRVLLLGKKDNPYPYINACDLYVQPSRYEGKCVTVREAQMLAKPVVITRYATSKNQLKDGEDGIIVPMDVIGCADGIARLLQCPEKMNQLIKNCMNEEHSNAGEVDKIYNLIE